MLCFSTHAGATACVHYLANNLEAVCVEKTTSIAVLHLSIKAKTETFLHEEVTGNFFRSYMK